MAVWIIGPRQVSGVSSGTKNPIEIILTPWLSAGTSLPSRCSGGCSTPIIIGTLGPYTSASIKPTLAPCMVSATARLTATVVLPTPPLPLLTAMVLITVLSGQAGVVSTTVNLTAPPWIVTSFTMFRVIRSLWSSGSITVRSASMTDCYVIEDMIIYN